MLTTSFCFTFKRRTANTHNPTCLDMTLPYTLQGPVCRLFTFYLSYTRHVVGFASIFWEKLFVSEISVCDYFGYLLHLKTCRRKWAPIREKPRGTQKKKWCMHTLRRCICGSYLCLKRRSIFSPVDRLWKVTGNFPKEQSFS